MTSKGVIYFNSGVKCLARLYTSIHSLRKHYDGPLTVISTGDDSNQACRKLFKDTGIHVIEAEFPWVEEGKNAVFLKKASVAKHTPYDLTIFLDSDTIILGPIEDLWDLAEEHEFVIPQFSNWKSDKKTIVRRIKGWEEVYPELMDGAINFGPAVNCGIFAFRRDSLFMKEWYQSIEPGRFNFIPDETGMQVILHKYPHYVANQKFNISCKFSDPYKEDSRILHYHGSKHCRLNEHGRPIYHAEIWLNHFEEVKHEINKELMYKDRQLRRYLNAKKKKPMPINRDMTLVTAVNPPYLDKFKLTLPTWQMKPQFKDCPLIVFHNGFDNPNEELSFVKEVSGRDVTLIPWDLPKAESPRELMLSSFVMGAPHAVKTDYWVKIDVDAYFCDEQDAILSHFFDYDIAGHKWKYTKSPKGSSWLATLDAWSEDKDIDGDNYLSEVETTLSYEQRRYSHRRIASFICLHNTEFTREAAEYVNDRLPVPSHDTYMWYICNRLPDRRWCWHNFKKLGVRNHTNYDKLKELVEEVQQKNTAKQV